MKKNYVTPDLTVLNMAEDDVLNASMNKIGDEVLIGVDWWGPQGFDT